MPHPSVSPLLALVVVPVLGFGASACSLLDTDFTGSVNLDFQIDDEDNVYQDIQLFDPNENDDFRDNSDRIKTGTLTSIEFSFLSIEPTPNNQAQVVLGRADIRSASSANPQDWVEGVSAWNGVAVDRESVFVVQVPADRQEVIRDLVFEADEVEPLEIRVDGRADQGPVGFTLRATLNMEFTAGI